MQNTSLRELKERLLLPIKPCLRDVLGSVKRYPIWGAFGSGNMIVFEVDGSGFHGGLCDRFKGIVSLYAFSKAIRCDFRIKYDYPFHLEDYFLPGSYDWRLRPGELSHNILNSRLMRLIGDSGIDRLKRSQTNCQLHVNANHDVVELINEQYGVHYEWKTLWSELFQPRETLLRRMYTSQKEIGSDYIGVAFRFQNLLGDYPEYDSQPLTETRQDELTEHCMNVLLDLQKQEELPLVVTSDSARFLALADNREGIYALKGRGAHEDTVRGASFDTYGKSIVDLLMLSGAKKIYAPAVNEMYVSGFPETASKIGNIPFERLLFRQRKPGTE